LRLLFVIKSLAVPGGGAERVLAELTSALAERGHQVTVASFDVPGSLPFYRFDDRVELTPLGVGRADRGSGPLEVLRRIHSVRRLARRLHPDVCVGFMHSAYVPLGFAAIGTGIRVIASEHTAYDHYLAFGFQGALVRATAPLFAGFTATTDRVRSGFPRSIARRMTVIPNPVMLPDIPPRRARSGPRLLSVGALRQEKGHHVLIAGFAKLADRFPDWQLRIVGDGPRRAELERQVKIAGLEGAVSFGGAVADVAPEYAAADLFVVPSSYESFGLATAEALAAGVSAVGFADCPGTNEIIANQVNGLLVAGPDRADALAEGLAKLMGDDALRARFGEAGPPSVARYSLNAVVDRWEQLILRTARSNGRPL
jgi:GalNAc-alpha-(1->4)-GalNAc-alpha-(1->3)-diNAcBac-PP-undecaprenol alpha-1,4-N-acetyl-D-galactosaminyltransferase